MPKTKISEFSSTPASNTDIDSINIAEGCAPSGINDAIRELMAQLKDFQTGAVGDSFNGPVGTTTAAAGAFTTLSASSTVSGTGFSTYLASPPAIGGTAAAAVSATTLTTSSTVTLNGGTANGVAYLNGSKVVTSGSALTFDGSFANLTLTSGTTANGFLQFSNSADGGTQGYIGDSKALITGGANSSLAVRGESNILFGIASAEGMRLTSTGLGIGTSSPAQKIQASSSGDTYIQVSRTASGTEANLLLGCESGSNVIYSRNATTGNAPLLFYTGTSERMRLDSSGNLGLGVTPSAWNSGYKALEVKSSGGLAADGTADVLLLQNLYLNSSGQWIRRNAQAGGFYNISGAAHIWYQTGSSTAGSVATLTQAMTLDASGNLGVGTTSPSAKFEVKAGNGGQIALNNDGSQYTTALWQNNGTSKVEAYWDQTNTLFAIGPTAASSSLVFQTAGSERARIDSSGNFLVGTTTTSVSSSLNGFVASSNGEIQAFRSGGTVAFFNRNTDDGTIVSLRQADTEEGSISVSGTTVSYNGGHLSRWAQTTTAKDDSLVKGTVLSNLDAMNIYTDAEGNTVANEQLNKVKVSDTEGDANVAGVFVNWSHDEVHNVDEINMAMTGDMIIRIAQGTTVQRGDLLMSAGNGTAKPQGDDIVRSKTIAKVTSNHVTCTYADGSYCVPCVLMAC